MRVNAQGQMSPPVLLRPRSLSPTPAARQCCSVGFTSTSGVHDIHAQHQAAWSYPILSPNGMPADTQNAKLASGTFCWCLSNWLNAWMLQPFQGLQCF